MDEKIIKKELGRNIRQSLGEENCGLDPVEEREVRAEIGGGMAFKNKLKGLRGVKMRSNGGDTLAGLINAIHECYGFEKALIKNPEQCGSWHVRFEVNGIKYNGAVSFHGALPTLETNGYTTNHYYHDAPIEDWFYEEFIKGRQFKIRKCTDADSGDWEDTGIIVESQERAKEYIDALENPDNYWYDIVN